MSLEHSFNVINVYVYNYCLLIVEIERCPFSIFDNKKDTIEGNLVKVTMHLP